MKLGSDFNASKPSDGDYVRHPSAWQLARELRYIKARVADFFGRCFDLGTGDLKDDIIPVPALKDSATKPGSNGQFYKRVTVDKNGFVLSGSFDAAANSPRPFRAVYTSGGAWVENPTGIVRDAAGSEQDIPPTKDEVHWVNLSYNPGGLPRGHRYTFIVPAGVTRLKVLLQGGYPSSTSPLRPTAVSFDLDVSAGEALEVFVAAAGGISYLAKAGYTTYVTSEQLSNTPSGSVRTLFGGGFTRNPYRLSDVADSTPSPGLVLIEWYA